MAIHFPKSRDEWLTLRHKYVSSTEQAALHGLSPYMTAFELHHSKAKDTYTDFEAGERAKWGLRQEEAVARAMADDYGIKVRKLNAYVSKDGTGMGASFDYEIVGVKEGEPAEGRVLQEMYENNGPGILEVKTVDWLQFQRQWPEVEGEREAPAHIEIQVQAQLHVIERKWAAIGVLVGGNEFKLLVRDYDADVGKAFEARTKQFWKDLKAGKVPPAVFPQDADLIAHIYSYGDPSKVLDAQGNLEIEALCTEYMDAALLKKGAGDRQDAAKAKLLLLIGDASRVLVDGAITITAGTVAAARIEAYDRKAYRSFKVTKKASKNGAKE
jgi:putative phage-type endonuclease